MLRGGPMPEIQPAVRNVLFIMCDQLRWDALSCYGQSVIDTPNLDALARRGVRYDRAYVQGTTCGSSRMSWYTGRYVQTHGSRYNRVPLAINQKTLGDHLRPLGVESVLVGKTHMAADKESIARLGLDPDDPACMYVAECGFAPAERDDGLHPDDRNPTDLPYNRFLRGHGFEGTNPWHSAANAVRDDEGNVVSGWLLRASEYPAIVPDELSETAYMTNRAIDWIRAAGDDRWCMHLSFIKPHWPYVVSAPYHQMVNPNDLPTPNRVEAELDDSHPVLQALRRSRIGRTLSRDDVRRTVMPAYLGLVKQIDDHLGRLFAELAAQGRDRDTMIVFSSDHGDYLGDHWQGEKDWFHEESVRVPLIVVDPRPQADTSRGSASTDLVEAIDIVPTLVEALGGDLEDTKPWLEGRSLVPGLHGEAAEEKQYAMSESDFGFLEATNYLPPTTRSRDHRAFMLRTERHKYILSETGSNLLYDLDDEPGEYTNRAGDPALASIQDELHERLFEWFRRRAHDVTYTDDYALTSTLPGDTARSGIAIGYWDEADLAAGIAGELY